VKILCVEGSSQYRLMSAFLDAVAAEFTECGHHVVRMRIDDALDAANRPAADLVFAFGGVGVGADWDAPYLSWLVDSPVFTPKLDAVQSDRDGLFTVCVRHPAIVRDFLGVDIPTGVLPHGIALDPNGTAPEFGDDNRPIDVLVAGSFQPPPQPKIAIDVPELRNAMHRLTELAEQRWNHPMRDVEVCALFRSAADAFGLQATPTLHRFVAPLLAWLDQQARLRRRAATVEALDRAGIPVHLAGAGWEQLPLEHAIVMGPTGHWRLLDAVRNAKVVVNAGPPLFNGGWHERIPMAMAGGALCVTENNDFVAADAEVCALVERYEMPDVEQVGDLVRTALASPRSERAQAAYELVGAKHTWARRARELLAAVEI
jgi:hypothetical protein